MKKRGEQKLGSPNFGGSKRVCSEQNSDRVKSPLSGLFVGIFVCSRLDFLVKFNKETPKH
jgi:hypothetical protein